MSNGTFDAFIARLKAAVPHPGRRRDRVSILIPFLIISLGLMALAWRSYNLSVKMEQGANALAEQYAGYAAEITARRVDAAVRAEMAIASDEWQQMERRVARPTNASLSAWIAQHDWIVSALYTPDEDPTGTIYYSEVNAPAPGQIRISREIFTSTGIIRYTYDPRLLLASVDSAVRQQPLAQKGGRGTLAIQQQPRPRSSRVTRGARSSRMGSPTSRRSARAARRVRIRAIVRTAHVGGKGGRTSAW